MTKNVLTLLIILLTAACVTTRQSGGNEKITITQLKWIGVYDIPHNLSYNSTTIGGLSGIDYDSKRDVYYLISDDRSAINPARFYTARIFFTDKKIDSVAFVNVTTLLQPNGLPYPNSKQDAANTPDPEALRYNPVTGQMIWTSEGERIIRGKDTVLGNPSITLISPQGNFMDSFHLPANLIMRVTEKGPRQNGVLEGMSFANGYKTLYVNVEEPLYEDGPRAGITDSQSWIRIYRFSMVTKKTEAQYAYKLDPVAHPPTPAGAFMVNGVPDILSIGNNQLLVLERSFSTGRLPCTIKIFLTDMNGATDISGTLSLSEKQPARPLVKKLLLNMDDLGIYIDNIEGISFGPTLPNGHRTLLLVADNNFVAIEKTQFFLFEVIP